jgi:LSD1 subclass zinc finger protein
LGDIPFPLTPDGSCEWPLHDLIISHVKAHLPGCRRPNSTSVSDGAKEERCSMCQEPIARTR